MSGTIFKSSMKLKLRNALLVLGSAAVLTLVYPIVNQAAEPAPNAPSQTLSEPELKSLFARYANLKSLTVDFEQTKSLKDIPTKLKSQGHLRVEAPSSLVWTLTKPSFLKFELKGGDAQITSGEGADATVQKFSKAQMASSPQAKSLDGIASWLKFDPAYLTKEFTVSRTTGGKLKFAPKDLSNSPFSTIELLLTKDGVVKTLALAEKSGDLIELEFQKPTIVKLK